MALPNLDCNPYETLWEAGALRKQAAELTAQAEMYDTMAKLQLQKDGVPVDGVTIQPGCAVILAYGGPADSMLLRMPIDKVTENTKLISPPVGPGTPEGSDIVRALQMPATTSYEPALLIPMGPGMAALMVPKGHRGKFFADATSNNAQRSDFARMAMVRLMVNFTGYNPGMIHAVISGAITAVRAQAPDNETMAPVVIQLGGG